MVANSTGQGRRQYRPQDVDLWQVVRKMVDDVDKPKPQNKEFFGTIKRVLGKSHSCFSGNEAQEKLRLEGNLPTDTKSIPTYALVEVPYFTSKERDVKPPARPDAFYKAIASEEWEYNLLTVDISGLGSKASKSEGFHIIFVFDEEFKHPKFVRMPSFKDNPIFPKAKKNPRPKRKRTAKTTSRAIKPPPRVAGYKSASPAHKCDPKTGPCPQEPAR